MHEGEKVIPKEKMDKAMSGLGGKPKPGTPRSTHIDHHFNGSATVKHQMHANTSDKIGMGDNQEVSYAVKDTPELLAKLKEYLGGGSAEPAAASPMPQE